MKRAGSILIAIFLVVSVFSFTGCDGNSNEIVDPEEETSVRDENTLLIWWSQEANDVALLNDMWCDFKDMYATGTQATYSENITMFSVEGNTDGTVQLEQQFMAGTAPDIIRMDHIYITTLGQKGVVFDLQETFQAKYTLLNQFISSTWKAAAPLNAVYGIPFDAYTLVFGAKSSALQQAGVSMPRNYEELRSVCARIQAAVPEQMPYGLPLGESWSDWPTFNYMTWLWRMGGDVLNEEMTEATFNDPETGVKALEMMIQLQDDGMISATTYEEGSTALCDYGSWWLYGFTEEMEFALQPRLREDVPQYSVLGVYDLAIVTTAANPRLAYDFVVHAATGKDAATDKHYQYLYCKSHGSLPSLYAAANTDEMWSADTTESEFWRAGVEQLNRSKCRPAVACWPEINEALCAAILSARAGEKTPQQALDDAADITNRLLNEG